MHNVYFQVTFRCVLKSNVRVTFGSGHKVLCILISPFCEFPEFAVTVANFQHTYFDCHHLSSGTK